MSRDREAIPRIGAHFGLSDAGEEMFSFTIDGGSKIGPRVATDEDRTKHAAAYDEFLAGLLADEGSSDEAATGADDVPKRKPGRPKKAG